MISLRVNAYAATGFSLLVQLLYTLSYYYLRLVANVTPLKAVSLLLCVCSKHKLSSRASKQSNVEESKFYIIANEDMPQPHEAAGNPPCEPSPMTIRRRRNISVLKSFKKPSSDAHCAGCNEVCVCVLSLCMYMCVRTHICVCLCILVPYHNQCGALCLLLNSDKLF